MCGRYSITTPPDAVRAHFGYGDQPNFPPRYNIAPTQPIPVVRVNNGVRQFALVRWGLVPSWARDLKTAPLLINARAETAAGKPSFRAAMRRRRCLIPADGFYEWQKRDDGARQPWRIQLKGGGVFAFAGIWETWTGPEGEEIDSAAILTTGANRRLAPIHHRMPVILDPNDYDSWLDADEADLDMAQALLRPASDDLLEAYPVSTRVNRVSNDDASILEPLAGMPEDDTSAKIGEAEQGNLF